MVKLEQIHPSLLSWRKIPNEPLIRIRGLIYIERQGRTVCIGTSKGCLWMPADKVDTGKLYVTVEQAWFEEYVREYEGTEL